MSRKLVFMVTHGPEDPERATIPFAMAVGAQAAGIEVVMGFRLKVCCSSKRAAPKKLPRPDSYR